MLRFAPSPNGPLHLGHALSALANERMALALGRSLTLRIEDIDVSRSRQAYVEAIVEDLAWLGVSWTPPMRRQSEHFALYREAITGLRRRGLVYPSFATRREILGAHASHDPRDPDGAPRFKGDAAILGEAETTRRRRAREPAAWRLDMSAALDQVARRGPLTFVEVDAAGEAPCPIHPDPAAWGDVVLARKETPTSYHLSVVVDDAEQGITHVVRGRDLFAATAVHRVLQAILDLPVPRYHHHPLILCPDGRKLSKSSGAQSLATLRQSGWSAPMVREAVARPDETSAASPTDEGQPERKGDE